MQYLELQSTGNRSGWKDFTERYNSETDCLNRRFGCSKSANKHSSIMASMFNIDDMKEKLKDEQYRNDFSKFLGYFNTKE